MWNFANHIRPEEKKQLKRAVPRQTEDSTDRTNHESNTSESSYKDVCIQYYMPAQEIIQLKQTTPLKTRLQEQKIDLRRLGVDFMTLVTKYDALPNTDNTRAAQQRYLYALLALLNERIDTGEETPLLRTALNILQDELSFVCIQDLSIPPVPPASPWEHMDSSPYLRMVAELTHLGTPTQTAAQPGPPKHTNVRPHNSKAPEISASPAFSRQNNFSSLAMIQALNRHHIEQLIPTQGPHLNEEYFKIFGEVQGRLLQEGMLSHYTHNPNLTVLHSTNYLDANRVLKKKGLSKSEKVEESETVSKSQGVDTSAIRNTGFVFFFLERIGSSHRNTDFGTYRFTVPLREQPDILNDAWAILHDIPMVPASGRPILHDTPSVPVNSSTGPDSAPVKQTESADQKKGITKRIYERTYDAASTPEPPQSLQSALKPYLSPAAPLFGMLSMFFLTADQSVFLQTPDGKKHDTQIQDHSSGNFLLGTDIINGIALRIAHELLTLKTYNAEEYDAIMGNSNTFWDYVSCAVHDVQIMVPHDVLPTQYDFIDRPRPAAGAGAAAGSAVSPEIAETGTSSAAATITGAPETEGASAARMITRPVGAGVPRMRRLQGTSADAVQMLRLRSGSANNCFFDAMFPLINIPEIENADALRDRFAAQQNDQGLTPLPPNAPVEYQHIQQFADLFHVAVTVMVEIHEPDAETVLIDFIPHGGFQNHYYIRFLPPADPQGIGHFTGLS